MKNLLIIEGDTFFINERLKEIDRDYYVVFNLEKQKYEVHVHGQAGNSYVFTLPFDSLDERALLFAQKTRIENMDKILEEIERDNEQSYERLIKQQVNLLKEII